MNQMDFSTAGSSTPFEIMVRSACQQMNLDEDARRGRRHGGQSTSTSEFDVDRARRRYRQEEGGLRGPIFTLATTSRKRPSL